MVVDIVGFQGQQQQQGEERRIYLVTDGCKSKQTQRVYSSVFNGFLKFINAYNNNNNNPNLQGLIDLKSNVIESKIISYLEYLRDTKHLSYFTIQTHYAAINHFFEMNDITLKTKKIRRFLPENESNHYDRPYSIPEIQQLLDKADIRSRVIILLLASTGMRVRAIPGLKLSDIKYIDEFGLYLIWVYNNSRKDRYYTFCTPECTNAIKAYLEYRERLGEQIKDSSPVIRNFISIDNPFRTKAPRSISVRTVQDIIIKLQKEAGLCDNNNNNVMLCHGFRKTYITTLDRVGIQFSCREFLSGHHLPNQDASYIRATEEDRLKEYLKAADALTIDPTQRLQQKVKDLEGQQAQEIAQLSVKVKELDEWAGRWKRFYQIAQAGKKVYPLKYWDGWDGDEETRRAVEEAFKPS